MMATAGSKSGGDRDRLEEPERSSFSLGVILIGLIGATATTVAASRLRRTVDWVYNQVKSQSNSSWWGSNTNSTRERYSQGAWKRYNSRMQEEHEEEMERLERIKHMQSVFNRERSKYQRPYESWQDQGTGAYQHSPRNDWYWEADTSYKDKRTNFRAAPEGPRTSGNHMRSHHYAILGLNRSRAKPYSDDEIKIAFRAKAMECHPDQNQDNKGKKTAFMPWHRVCWSTSLVVNLLECRISYCLMPKQSHSVAPKVLICCRGKIQRSTQIL